MIIRKFLVLLIAVPCLLWMSIYLMLGAAPLWFGWYKQISSLIFEDAKGGVPMLMLSYPTLISSSVTILLLPPLAILPPQRRYVFVSFHKLWASASLKRFWRCHAGAGDWNFNTVSAGFVLVFLIYGLGFAYRHLAKSDGALDRTLMSIGNSFGFMSMMAMAIFLIPATRLGPLLSLVQWNVPDVIRIHIWLARLATLCGALHGIFHASRWFLRGENIVSMIWPPSSCWWWNQREEEEEGSAWKPTCISERTECDCPDFFRNWTGMMSVVALLGTCFLSLHFLRRSQYSYFYLLHILFGFVAIVFAIVHYKRLMLYISPGVLYYVATTLPAFLEWRCFQENSGLKVLSVLDISLLNDDGPTTGSLSSHANGLDQTIANNSSNNNNEQRPCIAFVFEATPKAMKQYRPGQYLRIHVPEISAVSHPLTVNVVPNQQQQDQHNHRDNKMMIIFRATGFFTTVLRNRLLQSIHLSHHSSSNDENNNNNHDPTNLYIHQRPPVILANGFHGSQNRLRNALEHETLLVVAGGIGITPYLTLLHQLTAVLGFMTNDDNTSWSRIRQSIQTQQIIFHWICRDEDLIRFISKEYLEPLLLRQQQQQQDDQQQQQRSHTVSCSIRIVIHRTSSSSPISSSRMEDVTSLRTNANGNSHSSINNDLEHNGNGLHRNTQQQPQQNELQYHYHGTPFVPTFFSAGKHQMIVENIPFFLSFVFIFGGGLCAIWILYTLSALNDSMLLRLEPIIAIAIIALIVSCAMNILIKTFWSVNGCDDMGEETQQSSISATTAAVATTTTRRRRYNGFWWGLIEDEAMADGDLHIENNGDMEQTVEPVETMMDDQGSKDVELTRRKTSTHESNMPKPDSHNLEQQRILFRTFVTLEEGEAKGRRPSGAYLLRSIGKSCDVGLFLCGPQSLVTMVKNCAKSMDCSTCGGSSRFSFYEETFEL